VSPPWRQPFETALQRNAPQRELQVATVSPEGVPSVRTVVLRGITADARPFFYTDVRTRKANHLAENPKVALHAWFPLTREQFRLTGRAGLHGSHAEGPWAELRHAAWLSFDDEARLAFIGPPPGRTYVTPIPREVPPAPPQEFLVVSVDVTEVDWLALGPPPARAGFRLLGAGWMQQSLTP
jgi:hypothetical protein